MPQDDDKKIEEIDQETTTFEAEFDAAMKDLQEQQSAAVQRLDEAVAKAAQQAPPQPPAADDAADN